MIRGPLPMLTPCEHPRCKRLSHLRYCPDHATDDQRAAQEELDLVRLARAVALGGLDDVLSDGLGRAFKDGLVERLPDLPWDGPREDLKRKLEERHALLERRLGIVRR